MRVVYTQSGYEELDDAKDEKSQIDAIRSVLIDDLGTHKFRVQKCKRRKFKIITPTDNYKLQLWGLTLVDVEYEYKIEFSAKKPVVETLIGCFPEDQIVTLNRRKQMVKTILKRWGKYETV